MRVLIGTDRIGALASADAGAALGRAFVAARPGVEVAVVPMGSGGTDLVAALRALGDDAVVVASPEAGRGRGVHHDHRHGGDAPTGVDPASTSAGVGRALADALAHRPRRVVVDLTGLVTHDAGAGLLAGLGARADVPLDQGAGGLAGLGFLDLSAARDLLGATELVAVVDPAELGDMLLGLRGLTSRRGRAAGTDPALMLATDAALGGLASALGIPDAPGMGAAGGAALALTALGAWTTGGPALCAQLAGLERTASMADVVVTGADQLDFATRGGHVVPEMAAIGERTMRPTIVVARHVEVSGRELRTFGVEVAYPLGGDADLDAGELTRRASGVALSWTW
ncbi:MAG: glycerate kinase [Nigerium sp.]|nr:glycerate kinase [Nigerium sp.]